MRNPRWSQPLTEAQIEILRERAKEKFPNAKPRIISDHGPQFIAKDFKEFIRISGMTHVRTSPYYPQSNGKMERWNKSVQSEGIRPGVPLSLEDGRAVTGQYIAYYNDQRLHSAIGYITPKDMLEGRREQIHLQRDRKLEEARAKREHQRQSAELPCRTKNNDLSTTAPMPANLLLPGETEAGSAGMQPC